MRESNVANAKPPECNSISTTEVTQGEITKSGFNGMKLVRDTSIPCHLPVSLTMVSQTLIDYRSLGGHFTAEMVELKADFAATSARSLPRMPT